jgi:hypothetical protein
MEKGNFPIYNPMLSLHGASLCKTMMYMKRIQNIVYFYSSSLLLLSPHLTMPEAMWTIVWKKLLQVYVKDTQNCPLEKLW